MDNVLEQDTAIAEEREQKEEERRNAQDKRDIYDKYVKEMHWPKVSLKKKKELEILKDSIKTSPYKTKKSPKSIYGSEHPGQADEISTGKGGNNKANSDHDGEKGSVKRRKIIWPDNPLRPKPKELKEGQKVDWLKD